MGRLFRAGFPVTDAIGSIQLDFSIFQAEHLLLYMMNAKRHCQQFQYFDCVSVLFAVSVGTPERRPCLAFFATVFTPSCASSPHPPPPGSVVSRAPPTVFQLESLDLTRARPIRI